MNTLAFYFDDARQRGSLWCRQNPTQIFAQAKTASFDAAVAFVDLNEVLKFRLGFFLNTSSSIVINVVKGFDDFLMKSWLVFIYGEQVVDSRGLSKNISSGEVLEIAARAPKNNTHERAM